MLVHIIEIGSYIWVRVESELMERKGGPTGVGLRLLWVNNLGRGGCGKKK